MWMNEYEVEEAANRFGAQADETPNLYAGARVLYALMRWTNDNSDGWPYWQKPGKAAKNLMDALHMATQAYYRGTLVGDMTDEQLAKALTPIKAFLTRQGVDHGTVLPWAAIL
jgi:hypothetical protein